MKLTIYMIATKAYVRFAIDAVESIRTYFRDPENLQVLVLTDNPEMMTENINPYFRDAIEVIRIESLGWPEATLLRFHLFLRYWSRVRGDIVMYMDADTQAVASFGISDLISACNKPGSGGVALVQHPGYFNRNWFYRAAIRTRRGPWESRRASSAFVKRQDRKTYVCGGVFWALNERFWQISTEIARCIDVDQSKKIRARHNDESHLNNWFVKNKCGTVTPDWAFADGYRNLRGLIPRIKVIHKPGDFVRVGSDIKN